MWKFLIVVEFANREPEEWGFMTFERIPHVGEIIILKAIDNYKAKVLHIAMSLMEVRVQLCSG